MIVLIIETTVDSLFIKSKIVSKKHYKRFVTITSCHHQTENVCDQLKYINNIHYCNEKNNYSYSY